MLSANRTAELGDEESDLQGLAKSPTGSVAPFTRQTHIVALDLQNVAGNFNTHSLPRQASAEIGRSGFPVGSKRTAEPQAQGIEDFDTRVVSPASRSRTRGEFNSHRTRSRSVPFRCSMLEDSGP